MALVRQQQEQQREQQGEQQQEQQREQQGEQQQELSSQDLNLAAKRGDVDKVRKLLESGRYDVNCVDTSEWTLLHVAGHLDVVKLLIPEFEADVNACTNSGVTPLHMAAYMGHLDVVKVLISEFKADVNACTNSGVTPLHMAAYRGHLDVVKVLISEFKADVNAHTNSGETPLHMATSGGHLDVVKVLIAEFKADVNAQTNSGETLLHEAAYRGHLDVVKVLIAEFKADVNACTNRGETPLHRAAYRNHLDVVKVLISEFKAGVNALTNSGETPLHKAAYWGHLDVVKVLISEFKADVNAQTNSGETPLHEAAYRGHLDVIKVLISEFKAGVNAPTNSGETPLHRAAYWGHLDVVKVLVSELKTGVNAHTNSGETPLHMAASGGHLDVVMVLISEFKADVNAHTNSGETPLHKAAYRGHLDVVKLLIAEFKADVNAHTDNGETPLHKATHWGHLDVIKVLISEFKADVNAHTYSGETPLHGAASGGHKLISELKASVNTSTNSGKRTLYEAAYRDHLDVVKVLISEFKADVNACTNSGETPLHEAAYRGHLYVVKVLISEFKADVNAPTNSGETPLHKAAYRGHLDVVKVLVSEFKAGVNALTNSGETPLHKAAYRGHLDVVKVLVSEFKAGVNALTNSGETPLHKAAYRGHLDVVKVLVSEFKAGVNALTNSGETPLHKAAYRGNLDVVKVLISEFKAGVNAPTNSGETPLHRAAYWGHLDVVKVLVSEFKAGVNAPTNSGETPLHEAAYRDYLDVVKVLISEFKADVNAHTGSGETPLHKATSKGHLSVVRMLLLESETDVNVCNKSGNTSFDMAVSRNSEEMALVLMNEFHCNTKGGTPYIHTACERGWVDLVRALVQKHGTDILNHKFGVTTSLHVLAKSYGHKVALMLIKEFGSSVRDLKGQSLLHIACEEGNDSLVRTLILKGKADVTARDNEGNTPLHVAAMNGRENFNLISVLINEFGCVVKVKGHMGRSPLHSACLLGNNLVVRLISKHDPSTIWMVDDNGDTPLHLCAREGKTQCVTALLELDPPVMVRNNSGQTPKDVAKKYGYIWDSYSYIDAYMKENKSKITSHYELVQKHAKKKYSLPEPITRAFVVGNPGAGKSSFIETLKREGFFDWLWRVSESSVPPHTAGIVPSIHTSKYYGRVLFFDFAGDAEYYSSHAAILKNLASSRKGDNVFLLVIDMNDKMAQIKKIFHYWLSFIHHQQFYRQKPRLIVVGSHLDLLTEDVANTRGKEFQMFYDSIDTEAVQLSALFMLDCCKPRSNQVAEFQTLMNKLTKHSPRIELSFQASILLGLLEKDFSNVTACSIQTLLTHIEETGIELPTDTQLFHPILLELHDLGLLFLVDSSNRESSSVVLNMSQLTNRVHNSLFSKEAILEESFEKDGLSFSFSAGIVPQSILSTILPENITKECLVQLQYCQEISHAEARVFPTFKVSDSTDQSFLFFPALCSADKSDVEWCTDFSYGIGWLARCTSVNDYFSPRFHHVLVLRLVFKFTLSAHPPADQVLSGSPDLGHFQRRCTVWKTGVHWLMEEGVECMVELADANKEVVVLTRSTKDGTEDCAAVFNDIISCVMEAKAEFCHSVRLEFFLLDSTSEADYHSADNLFSMRDAERVLTSADRRAIVSASGKRQMERSKLLCWRNFTLWYSFFPMDYKSVLQHIKDVVKELYMLGLHLIPQGTLDAIEADNRTDVGKMRRELVKGWMSSSLDPPCWWHMIKALQAAECGTLADKIAKEFGK